jgi:type II secretory pathway component PulJ
MKFMSTRSQRSGFTLIELLVVIAINSRFDSERTTWAA